MSQFNNSRNLPISVAAFLAHETYERIPNTLSATQLIKPIRQTILSRRVPEQDQIRDVNDVVKARLGTAIHDGIERTWSTDAWRNSLIALGYPESIVNRIVVNPPLKQDPITGIETLDKSQISLEDPIPVFVEKRTVKQINGHAITGQFDFVMDGQVQDFKTTSVWTYIYSSKLNDYKIQGSIYKWLNPGIITADYMSVHYIFTDWSKMAAMRANSDADYPPTQVIEQKIPLFNIHATEGYITHKLKQLDAYSEAAEHLLPQCLDEDLWRKPTVYKYYKNPNAKRATKNYDNLGDAVARTQQEGGIYKEQKGEVVACKFCPAFSICTQKDQYLADGSLIMDES